MGRTSASCWSPGVVAFPHLVLVTQLTGQPGTRVGAGGGFPTVCPHGSKSLPPLLQLHSKLLHLVISKCMWMAPEGESRCQENGVLPETCPSPCPWCSLPGCRVAVTPKLYTGKWGSIVFSFLMVVSDGTAGYFNFAYLVLALANLQDHKCKC